MSKPPKPFTLGNKRKRKLSKATSIEAESMKESPLPENALPKVDSEVQLQIPKKKKSKKKKKVLSLSEAEIGNKYPVLKDKELQEKFMKVTLTNNQKGRIRQVLKDNLKGVPEEFLPDVINNKIQLILKSEENLNDTELRKIRILFNMLKMATEKSNVVPTSEIKSLNEIKSTDENKSSNENKSLITVESETKSDLKEEKTQKVKKEKSTKVKNENDSKVKGPKRYVVFIGNLPLDIDKEKIQAHFSDLSNHITDLRLPKLVEGKKAAIAYLELKDEPSYELALSKHHSMLANKRINVLYTTQQGSKITKTEAKGKAAKLIALQKSGHLLGSVPLSRKRSQRRKKMKLAKAKQEAEIS